MQCSFPLCFSGGGGGGGGKGGSDGEIGKEEASDSRKSFRVSGIDTSTPLWGLNPAKMSSSLPKRMAAKSEVWDTGTTLKKK